MKENLGIIILENAKSLGTEVTKHINEIRKNNEDYIIPIKIDRFSNGEGKAKILSTVRDKDIYIITPITIIGINFLLLLFILLEI